MQVLSNGQAKTDPFLKDLLLANKDSILQEVIHHPEKYRFQIIYTQIDRDQNNHPSFKNYYYNVDPDLYFNPASTVKMPLAFLTLEKLHEINKRGVNKYSSLQIDSNEVWQTKAFKDTTSKTGFPSLAQYIKKAFLVSDNDAYNRLYQFLGQETINRKLHQKGYPDIRITKQFLGLSMEQNRYTNGMRFIDNQGKILYEQPPAYNRDTFDFSHVVKLGKDHWDANDSLVSGPMDFTEQNNISLEDLQQIEQSVLFPQSIPAKQRFHLSPEDYQFLYQYMSQYPSETNYPKYDSSTYYDSYVKFFFRGEKIPSYVRIFNKVGWSYGFLTDISYVVDFKNKVEFMLSAVVYVNKNQIMNDGDYEYDSLGHPFLKEVGQTIYQYELSRKRVHLPDLSRFKINYEKRIQDNRPTISEVDN